jgi:CheY-like chemotaxis protein
MKTILVLEDDSSLMMLLRRTLKEYHLLEATTAEEALQLFGKHDRHVDLLLTDVTLPTSSGLRVAYSLRSEIRNLPVILTSGYPVSVWSDRDSVDLERLGPNSVAILQKPFQTQALSKLVHAFLGTATSEGAAAHGED